MIIKLREGERREEERSEEERREEERRGRKVPLLLTTQQLLH